MGLSVLHRTLLGLGVKSRHIHIQVVQVVRAETGLISTKHSPQKQSKPTTLNIISFVCTILNII